MADTSGENPKNDTRGCTPHAQPKRCHGRIENDGGVARHGGVDQRSGQTNLDLVSYKAMTK